jgi:hypothetical protein
VDASENVGPVGPTEEYSLLELESTTSTSEYFEHVQDRITKVILNPEHQLCLFSGFSWFFFVVEIF